MKIFIKTLSMCCLAIFGSVTLYAQQATINRIDSVMQLAYSRGIFNGNILVAQKNKVIYERSFGPAGGGQARPLNTDMLFDVGSISKEFNGAAIMILKEQEKLSLDDSLSKYFPEFTWAGEVRIRNLINYTSGIPLASGPGADGSDSLIYAGLLKLKKLAFTPGTGYIYNYANVYLQQRIIEKVSGLPYAVFVQRYLFRPAGMRSAVIDLPVTAANMAQAFDSEGRNTPYPAGVSGWVRLPARDLYYWASALHSGRIISKKSLAELSAGFPGGESSLGNAGLENEELVWHEHQGSNYNYEGLLYSYLPEAITIIMMTNNQQMKVQALKSALMQAIHRQAVNVPRKSLYLAIREKLLVNVDSGLAFYRGLKTSGRDQYDFSSELPDLLSAGKFLQRRKHTADAIKIFLLAVEMNGSPQTLSYGYELLAGCYTDLGDQDKALAYYRKALELDPGNKNAEGMIRTIIAKS